MAHKHTFKWKDGTRTETLTAMKAIRYKCYDCSNWSQTEIRDCTVIDCPSTLSEQGRRGVPES